jgi:hypothetical protein
MSSERYAAISNVDFNYNMTYGIRYNGVRQPVASITSEFSQENGNTMAHSSSVEVEKRI